MKNNLSRTVRLVSALDVDKVRSRIRLQFMPGEPCYSGNVEGKEFTLSAEQLQISWRLPRGGTPQLQFCLVPADKGTIIGLHTSPATISPVGLVLFMRILVWSIGIILLCINLVAFCVPVLVLIILWELLLRGELKLIKNEYRKTRDLVVWKLAGILQATLEDIPEE